MTDGGDQAQGATESIRAHLAALPGGVGCRHLARERDAVDASLIVRLGLAKPILRNVPRCADHGCPWQPRCEHWPAFEPESPGPVSGIKYKPTPLGVLAASDASLVGAAVSELPLAAEVDALLEHGPASVFTLHTHYLRRARLAVREEIDADLAGLDRVALGGVLDLLVELGRLTLAADGVTYHRITSEAGQEPDAPPTG